MICCWTILWKVQVSSQFASSQGVLVFFNIPLYELIYLIFNFFFPCTYFMLGWKVGRFNEISQGNVWHMYLAKNSKLLESLIGIKLAKLISVLIDFWDTKFFSQLVNFFSLSKSHQYNICYGFLYSSNFDRLFVDTVDWLRVFICMK